MNFIYSEQIMGSIKRHRNAMVALLAEYIDRGPNAIESNHESNDFVLDQKRYLIEKHLLLLNTI